MSTGITLNASMRSNLSSLRLISAQMGKVQERLATGLKVNSAIDNASSYYQARSLTNRAADLEALLDSMGQGIQTIEAATKGLETGATFLEQATAVIMGTESKIPDDSEAVYLQVSTIDELKEALANTDNKYIEITQSLTFADNDGITVGAGVTLKGADGVELTFRDTTQTKYKAAVTVRDKAVLKNLTINSTTTVTDRDDENSNYMKSAVYYGGQFWYDALNINTYGDNNFGLRGSGELYGNADIKTDGIRSYGIYMSASITGGVHNIETRQDKAIAVYCQRGAINDGIFNIKTSGEDGRGVYCYVAQINGGMFNIETDMASSVFLQNSSSINGGTFNITAHTRSAISTWRDCSISGGTFNLIGQLCLTDNTVVTGGDFRIYASKGTVLVSDDSSSIVGGSFCLGYEDQTEIVKGIPDLKYTTITKKDVENHQKSAVSLRDSKKKSVKKILDEYDKLIADSSYQGVNLLTGGKSDVVFNENRSHKFTVEGTDMRSAALGLNADNWQTQEDIARALSEIASALNTIRSFQEKLGNNYSIIQTRQNFTDALTDILETGADGLTLADMNEASADYLSLQTRQQLAINSLSLAAESTRSILSLF